SPGFQDFKVTVDKYQRRSLLAFPFLIVPLPATNWIVYHRDKITYGTLDERNAWAVRAMNSRDLLLGRTLIVTAVKPVSCAVGRVRESRRDHRDNRDGKRRIHGSQDACQTFVVRLDRSEALNRLYRHIDAVQV